MKKLTKFERELNEFVFELAKKYGYHEIGICGTLDPKWYKKQMETPCPGISILFYNEREK